MNARLPRLLAALAHTVTFVHAAAAGTNDVHELAPIEVWAESIDEPTAGVAENAWGGAIPSLEVRSQGEFGTGGDLVINGSSFSEAGIVFNGATLRNAQTEHFNADLPVAADWLQGGRVLTGLELFREGAGHPAGSVAARTAAPEERGGKVTTGVGLDGLVFGRVDDVEVFEVGDSGRIWVGAFADAARADRIDGYESNPMDRASAGGRLGFGTEEWTLDALVAWAWRDFGCTGSYGANEKYPAWERDGTGLVSADWRYDAGDDQTSEISVLWSRGRDEYELYRDNPDYYRNTHLSDSVSLHGRTRRHFSDRVFVDLRGDSDTEAYSTTHHVNYTGTDPKTKSESFRRFHGAVAVLPGVGFGNWEFAAGGAGEFYSEFDATCAPAGGIAYRLDDDTKFELSYREGCRMPSFTELTYDSPDSKGTRDLPLQRTRSLNLDATCGKARGGLFLMRSERLVDWLKDSPSSGWKATPLDPVTAFGASGDVEWEVTESLTLVPRGAVTVKSASTDYWASRYAMDFPVASFSLEATYRITDTWRVSCRQGVEAWKSNPVRRGTSVRNVSRAETVFEVPFCRDLELTIGLSDLFDQAFEVYPGQKASGFTGYLAITYRW